jgi:hypothetical protein
MAFARHMAATLTVLAMLAGGGQAFAEPLFTLSDDGRTFLYRARPGDNPATVAEMFGIPAHDVPAFLTANGITDATRVGAGFTYRIPNAALRGLAERTANVERENARLTRSVAEEKERARDLVRETGEARAAAAQAEAQAARLARLDRLWPWAKGAIFLLLLAGTGAGYTAATAFRRHVQAERYARTLARELDDKRKAALAERQESARRILELETRLRALESQVRPRVVISGRGGS